MTRLPEPINGTEAYLAAVLGELRALRVAVEGGAQAPTPDSGPVELTEPAPTKRTRTRARG